MENTTTIKLKPQAGGWLFAYIILSLPGFVLSMLVLILITILTLGGLAAASTASQNAQDPDALQYEFVDGNKDSKNKILSYEMNGSILNGGSGVALSELQANIYTDKINADFKKIKEDDTIKAVLFDMDTPGGEVTAAEEIGDSINDLLLAKNQPKSVFYWGNVVASGGVFVTVKAKDNYVVASPYGESGSIGVITRIPDLQGLYDKIGVRWRVYKSAESKDYGSEARDPTQVENDFIQSQIDRTYNRFVDLVASGRKLDREKVLSFANGFVYPNQESKNLGLVDEIGSFTQSYQKLAQFSKINENDYQVVRLVKETDFLSDLFGQNIKAGIVSSLLGVDTSSLNKLNLKGTTYLFDPRFVN
jgi:protease-4